MVHKNKFKPCNPISVSTIIFTIITVAIFRKFICFGRLELPFIMQPQSADLKCRHISKSAFFTFFAHTLLSLSEALYYFHFHYDSFTFCSLLIQPYLLSCLCHIFTAAADTAQNFWSLLYPTHCLL